MADVFKDQISLRELTPTNLLLPGNGDGGNVVTVSWGGNILKEDMIHVPGLTGCMGIICIARTPIKQAVPQAAAAAANSRVSVNRESVRELSRNSNGYTQYVKDDLQKKQILKEIQAWIWWKPIKLTQFMRWVRVIGLQKKN